MNFNSPNSQEDKTNETPYFTLLSNFNLAVINKAITRFNKITQNHTIIDHILADKDRSDIIALTSNNIITDGFQTTILYL